jgi:hypothetical protein
MRDNEKAAKQHPGTRRCRWRAYHEHVQAHQENRRPIPARTPQKKPRQPQRSQSNKADVQARDCQEVGHSGVRESEPRFGTELVPLGQGERQSGGYRTWSQPAGETVTNPSAYAGKRVVLGTSHFENLGTGEQTLALRKHRPTEAGWLCRLKWPPSAPQGDLHLPCSGPRGRITEYRLLLLLCHENDQ